YMATADPLSQNSTPAGAGTRGDPRRGTIAIRICYHRKLNRKRTKKEQNGIFMLARRLSIR
ncbi:MAG: hypothetical protein ACK4MF_03425, partial [Hyphomicrobiaceae bacterium]